MAMKYYKINRSNHMVEQRMLISLDVRLYVAPIHLPVIYVLNY